MLEQIIAQLNGGDGQKIDSIFKAEGKNKSPFNQAAEITKNLVETERNSLLQDCKPKEQAKTSMKKESQIIAQQPKNSQDAKNAAAEEQKEDQMEDQMQVAKIEPSNTDFSDFPMGKTTVVFSRKETKDP